MSRLLSLIASLAPRHVPLAMLMAETDQYAVQPEQTACWRYFAPVEREHED